MLPVLLCCQMYQRDKHTVHHPRSTLRWDTASETVDFELKLVVRRDHCSIRWLHESAKQRPAQTSHNHETTPMRMRMRKGGTGVMSTRLSANARRNLIAAHETDTADVKNTQ